MCSFIRIGEFIPLDEAECRCGESRAVMTRIVGCTVYRGQDADKNSFPWQAALVFRGRSSPFCGGSLLTTR